MGLAQGLTDIDVLSWFAVFCQGTLDQRVYCVGGKDSSVAQASIPAICPGKFNPAFPVRAKRPAEQMCHVAAHLFGIGFDHGVDVAHGHSTARQLPEKIRLNVYGN
jgi:hypothetical protein